LAGDEAHRRALAINARARVETLSDVATLWPQWGALFKGLGA
jgi:hypothetical protein